VILKFFIRVQEELLGCRKNSSKNYKSETRASSYTSKFFWIFKTTVI